MKTVIKALVFDANKNVLVLRRSLSHPNYPHHLDFPGGELEPGETEAGAVAREIMEETGLQVLGSECNLVYRRRVSPGQLT